MTPWERIQNEPALVSGVILALINTLMIFGVIEVTADQVGQINILLGAILAIFTRRQAYGPVSGRRLESEVSALSAELFDQ